MLAPREKSGRAREGPDAGGKRRNPFREEPGLISTKKKQSLNLRQIVREKGKTPTP